MNSYRIPCQVHTGKIKDQWWLAGLKQRQELPFGPLYMEKSIENIEKIV